MPAGAAAESRLTPTAVNPTSGAFGIGQWLGPRKADLFRRYGRNPTLDQQLEFMLWELTNSEAGAGVSIKGAASPQAALRAYIGQFMRPGRGAAGDMRRGLAFLGGAQPLTGSGGAQALAGVQMSQKTDIHVYGGGGPRATGEGGAGAQDQGNAGL